MWNKNIKIFIRITIIFTCVVLIGLIFYVLNNDKDKLGDKEEINLNSKNIEEKVQKLEQELKELKEKNQQGDSSKIVTDSYEDEEDFYNKKMIERGDVKVEIVNGKEYCSDKNYQNKIYQKIIKVIYSDKVEKNLYFTDEPASNKECEFAFQSVCCLRLSPDGKYLFFQKTGWEWSKEYMLNVNTGKYVFGDDTEINDIYHISGTVKWSKNNRNFVFASNYNAFIGEGEQAVYVSKYNNPDKILKIWSSDTPFLTEIKNIDFIDENEIIIEIEENNEENQDKTTIKYKYDFETNKLLKYE